MEPNYGGTTQASDWGERDEVLERLRQIAALVTTLSTDRYGMRVSLGCADDGKAVDLLVVSGGERCAPIVTASGLRAIESSELAIDGVEFHAQYSRPSTQTERDAFESRSEQGVKTTGQQLVEACRAHGGSDAELGAAIDQALSEAQEQLRDRFAMAALTGLYAAEPPGSGYMSEIAAATDAYRVADAMLARKDVGTYASEIRVTATVDYLIRNWSTMTADEQIGYVRQIAERLSTAERAAARKVTP